MALTKFRCEDGPAGTRTIVPTGELDTGVVANLRRVLADGLAAGFERVIVDLSEVSYIDTTAIAMLMDASARAARARSRLLVVSPPDSRASAIFELTQVDKIMPVLETREEALRAA